MAEDYFIVRGKQSGVPILILPDGFVYLRDWLGRKADSFYGGELLRNNKLYEGELTDEEEAIVVKWILLGEPNNA